MNQKSHTLTENSLLAHWKIRWLGPYDFCDLKNEDKIVESIHKNGIYRIKWNVMELTTFWMNKSKVGLLT